MKMYIEYGEEFNIKKILKPSEYEIMGYIAVLFKKFRTPGTVFNYISGAKTWIDIMGGCTKNFNDYKVEIMRRGVYRKANHIKRQAKPLSVRDIKNIVNVFRTGGKESYVYTAATLICFFSLLRQSNLVTSDGESSSEHVLTQRDISISDGMLRLRIRTTKTTWTKKDEYLLKIPKVPNSEYCPVRAWSKYFKLAPKSPGLPVFWTLEGELLTPRKWMSAVRFALWKSNYRNVDEYTLHSIRRGGAIAAAQTGIDIRHVKEAGRWKSRAFQDYVPKNIIKSVPAALSTLFG